VTEDTRTGGKGAAAEGGPFPFQRQEIKETKNIRLRGVIDRAARVDENDTLQTKTALGEQGYYRTPGYGMTSYPDEPMFDGIMKYQRDNKLRVDGVMKPGGETEGSLNQRLAARSHGFKCTRCGVIHGGVYSPTICHKCYEKEFM